MVTASPICIDGRMLEVDGTGVATYASVLLSALEMQEQSLKVLRAKAGSLGVLGRFLKALPTGARHVGRAKSGDLTASSDIFREAQIYFNLHGAPMQLQTDESPGIMHWTYPVPLRLRGWINLYTVHDVIPLTHPHLTSINPIRHRRILESLLQTGGRFVTVSHASRRDIAASTGLDASRILVCHQGIADMAQNAQAPRRGDIFLFIGSIEPRKNLERLIDAHATSGSSIPLVLTGPLTSESGPVVQLAQEKRGVELLPYQNRETLLKLLGRARALLFPSLAEGFGLPIAEAMAMGTPVLTSQGGATEEIASGAALLVDPTDKAAISEAISRLAADGALCAALSRAGRQRAHHFGLPAYGARLIELYSKLLAC